MNPTSTLEPTRINYQIKNYNRNLQANSVSHHRRPDEEREQRERGARAGGREGGRSLYARRRGARWPGRRVSAGPWPACTAGTGSWRRRRRWSRACGRPRPGAAPRPSSSSAPSPPQARSRESIRRGEGGFPCVCNLFPLFFLPHLRPPPPPSTRAFCFCNSPNMGLANMPAKHGSSFAIDFIQPRGSALNPARRRTEPVTFPLFERSFSLARFFFSRRAIASSSPSSSPGACLVASLGTTRCGRWT
jgi:hypothetical protein